jgi:hypothetical protein
LRTASRIARHRDAFRIDIRPRLEIIDRPYAVPDKPARDVGAGEQTLRSRHAVLAGASAGQTRFSRRGVQILEPLALPGRVVRQHQISAFRQRNPGTLIELRRLAVQAVSRGAEECRAGAWPAGRNEDTGCHVWVRLAFEISFSTVCLHAEGGSDYGMQRRLFRKTTDFLDQLPADVILAFPHGGRRADLCHTR